MSALPDGWTWVDPQHPAFPWRAESQPGSKVGLAITIQGDWQGRVIAAAAKIDAAFAAVVEPEL